MTASANFFKKNYRRIVIKVGSSLLIEELSQVNKSDLNKFKIRKDWLKSMVLDCCNLIKDGTEIIITTSGAVALGRQILGFKNKKLSLQEKQAAAAAGQIELMSFYQKFFRESGLQVAQILLTAADCNSRQRFLNCKNTVLTLLKKGAVPIFNENDSVAVDEIKIGDNDRLASRVAQMIEADLLVLFSDIDGLFDKNPKLHRDAVFIAEVKKISREIEKMAGVAGSNIGTGGMITKISAAKMATSGGCDTIITNGIEAGALNSLISQLKTCSKNPSAQNSAEKKFTIFYGNSAEKKSKNISKSRKNWLSGIVNIKGEIIVNREAGEILRQKRVSLLAIGAVEVNGDFKKGDVVIIRDENGNKIASGVSNHNSETAKKILQKSSQEIAKILGKDAKPELVHVDNLAIE